MDTLATVLLRRTGRVALAEGWGGVPADGATWVAALEADLAVRGWLMRHDLRAAAALLPANVRIRWADWLLATVDDLVGADRTMTPLYRRFPDTPHDIEALFVRQLLTHLFAGPGAPCVLCGAEESGAPLDPCGHPVCRTCFPPEQVSGCPVCGRRLAAGDPYLTITPPETPETPETPRPAGDLPIRVAGLETDPAAAGIRLRDQLVARPTALGEADRHDLQALVAATAPGDLDWLPDVVPARETLALILGWQLHATALLPGYPDVVAAAELRWTTATDAARTLWAYSGGDPGLLRPSREKDVRVRAIPRALRRAVLAHLDGCGAVRAAEDLQRHPAVWKRLGERLHPYEKVISHPEASVAFAALRGTRTPRAGALGAAVVAACAREPRHLILIEHPDGAVSVRLRTHASLVERALADGDVPGAARLLAERPGDLWRRLDHLLRSAGDPAPILAAMQDTAASVAPGLIAAAAAELSGRAATVRATPAQLAATEQARAAARGRKAEVAAVATLGAALRAAARRLTGGVPPYVSEVIGPDPAEPVGIVGGRPGPGMPRRVFFPRGSVVTTWTEPERRPPLPPASIAAVRDLADGELAGRAARLDRYDVAVLDAALADVPAPMRERAASGQLAGWPRGTMRALPDADVLRFFLHWEEPGATRVDLDLSCTFYDRNWRQRGHCDYTQLRFAGNLAIHSGDFTSAPSPLGATEFLDLSLARLAGSNVHYAVPTVLSFNAVPFDQLAEAFAGVMLPLAGGAQFDGARVAQRFDLRGDAKMLLPMVVDVPGRRLLWTDLTLTGGGHNHSVGRHARQLARAAADQWEHFTGGSRASVLDVLAWHASGRAEEMLVTHEDGTCTRVAPGDLTALREAATAKTGNLTELPDLTGRRVLAGAVDHPALRTAAVAAGSTLLTLTGTPGDQWTTVQPADLLGELKAR